MPRKQSEEEHGHGEEEGHDHSHEVRDLRVLFWAIVLTLAAFLLEVVGGVLSNSLALLGDAGHMFSDVLSLGVAALALWLATQKAPSRRTFGYHRAEVFSAVFNGVLLIAISFFIIADAIARLQAPPEIDASLVFQVSVIGLLVNLAVAWKLMGHSNINVQGAFLHAASDALSSIGVILSAAIIYFTGMLWVDAAMSLVIAVIIFASAIPLLKNSFSILFEAMPFGLKIEQIENEIGKIKGVKGVHDLHVWSVCSEVVFANAHVVVDDSKVSQTACIYEEIACELQKMGITHATIQFETNDYGCGKGGLLCKLEH